LKSNLKKQVADLQSSVQELTKRVGSLQGKFDSYLMPRLQKMDKELVDLKNMIKPEIVVGPERQAGLRGTPLRCDHCRYVKLVANEDQRTIGICNNPLSIQYKKEVLAELYCSLFSPDVFSNRRMIPSD